MAMTLQIRESHGTIDVESEGQGIIMRGYERDGGVALCRAPKDGNPEQLIGQIDYGRREHVTFDIPGGALSVEKAGIFGSRDFKVDGPGFSWKWSRGFRESYTLTDPNGGGIIAKYEKSTFSSTSTLQVFAKLEPQAFEAVVLTALSMMEIHQDQKKKKITRTTAINAAI